MVGLPQILMVDWSFLLCFMGLSMVDNLLKIVQACYTVTVDSLKWLLLAACLVPIQRAGAGKSMRVMPPCQTVESLEYGKFHSAAWPATTTTRSEWKINSGLLRTEMRKRIAIRDASPGNVGGMHLNAESNLLQSRGWDYNSSTGYWNPGN
jgi:hypothetical protein